MEQVWWKQITNAANFIQSIVCRLIAQKSVALLLPEGMPWKDAFENVVIEKVTPEDSQRIFDVMESPAGDVGKFMLERYCDEDKRSEYRSCVTQAAFLAGRDDIPLNDRFVWVKGIKARTMGEWLAFVSDYRANLPKGRPPAVFILETSESDAVRPTKGIDIISFDSSISPFDAYTFCMLAISPLRMKDELKTYFAEITSQLCGRDVELCALCLGFGKDFFAQPADFVTRINESVRSTGEPFRLDLSMEMIRRRVWKAQIKTLFPLIEDFRLSFVRRHRTLVESGLPITGSNGEKITVPEEADLGELYHMFKNGVFVTLSDSEKNQLLRFREWRNTLAHCSILSLKEVEKLLSEQIPD